MRYLLWLALLAAPLVYAEPFSSTTKGRIILSCDGAKISEHVVETEATARALNYALEHGGKASCELDPPPKLILIDLPLAPPPGAAFISWTAPTTYTDGTALAGLTGYRVHYGRAADALTEVVPVAPNVTSYAVSGLEAGTWYFSVTAVTDTAVSVRSNIATKTVQ